jgi:hypothetical protein
MCGGITFCRGWRVFIFKKALASRLYRVIRNGSDKPVVTVSCVPNPSPYSLFKIHFSGQNFSNPMQSVHDLFE